MFPSAGNCQNIPPLLDFFVQILSFAYVCVLTPFTFPQTLTGYESSALVGVRAKEAVANGQISLYSSHRAQEKRNTVG